MNNRSLLSLLALLSLGVSASAQAPEWKYKTHQLSRQEVDVLIEGPAKPLVLDVRRPDELIRYGSFPVFLSVQAKALESQLAWLPKDRPIVTVSNHAHRAAAAGDLLAARGYTVVGAVGSEDYEKAGGTHVAHIQPPAAPASSSR